LSVDSRLELVVRRLFELRVAWPGLGGAFVINADRGQAMQAVQNSPKATIANSCYTTMIQRKFRIRREAVIYD